MKDKNEIIDFKITNTSISLTDSLNNDIQKSKFEKAFWQMYAVIITSPYHGTEEEAATATIKAVKAGFKALEDNDNE